MSAPLPRPHVYAFNFGALRVATVLDTADVRTGLATSFAIGQKQAAVEELCAANFIDPDRFEHPFIPTFIDTGMTKILFDTGLGEPESLLLTGLDSLGVGAHDIDVVILTHGHPDHIGGLKRDGALVFPRARYVFGKTEFDFWMRGEGVREARRDNHELFLRNCAELADKAIFVKPGEVVQPGITAVDAAGHSPGLIAYTIESDGRRMLVWSDTCLHYVLSLQRPDWQAAVDDDKDEAARTRRRLLAMAADQKLLVAGYHMPFPGLEQIPPKLKTLAIRICSNILIWRESFSAK